MDYKTIDCYCSVCKHRTHHIVLGEGVNVSPDEDYFYRETLRVVKCCGCDNVSFDKEVEDESNVQYTQEGYEELVTEHISYPFKENSIEPLRSWDIPSLVKNAYNESVDSLNNGNLLLAAIWFRATVEALCLQKGIDTGKLVTKINKLRDKGIITAADCERLHEARFMGNESAHQIEKPDREHVMMVLEVINNILNNLYIIDKKFKEVFEYRFRTTMIFKLWWKQALMSAQKAMKEPSIRSFQKKENTGRMIWINTKLNFKNVFQTRDLPVSPYCQGKKIVNIVKDIE